jgi:hypothetical protein
LVADIVRVVRGEMTVKDGQTRGSLFGGDEGDGVTKNSRHRRREEIKEDEEDEEKEKLEKESSGK